MHNRRRNDLEDIPKAKKVKPDPTLDDSVSTAGRLCIPKVTGFYGTEPIFKKFISRHEMTSTTKTLTVHYFVSRLKVPLFPRLKKPESKKGLTTRFMFALQCGMKLQTKWFKC